jgi:hypothetical protein
MTTLIEKSILNERLEKSRSGTYADTSENRRKHRVGQKYGSEKKEEEKPEKTSSNEKDPAKELEAVDKVIAAINEGKLKLPQEEIMVLIEKKNNLELAKRQAEKIHSGVKANEEKRNAKEIKETNKKINEASKQKKYGDMNVEEAKKETSNEEAEVYTRIKFEDVPNSGKINLKKYLSEKVRKGVDEKWSNIKNIPTENLKKMEKGLVNDLNKNFEAIKKSQRAELLYSIMKVKGELEKRGKESQKKE